MNDGFNAQLWINMQWNSLTVASKFLMSYGVLMAVALILTFVWSLNDARVLRDVGVWVKPMKFMSATALFAVTTVWVLKVANSHVDHEQIFTLIVVLLVSTSLFEVVYITYQASQASASHYNVEDAFHALMFGIMGIAAVGLTASQAWLAWEIWKEQQNSSMPVETLGVIIGLVLTFVLSTVSGFMLGGNQPPSGQGIPLVGWHLHKDIRPAHFLGVHAQQFVPLIGILAGKFLGSYSIVGLQIGAILYCMLWLMATWLSI